MMDEQAYRSLMDQTLRRIDDAFADVDPDLAESSLSQGALTIQFADGSRAIVSPQPPVRQAWLAFRDRAWHFDWDVAGGGRWMDDRGEGETLFGVLERISRETAGVAVRIE